MYSPLDRVLHQGGPVAATVLCVQRVHPLLFFEATAKGPVFRSQRAQHDHQRQQSQALQEVRWPAASSCAYMDTRCVYSFLQFSFIIHRFTIARLSV